MATVELHRGDEIAPGTVRRLVKEANRLNKTLGDPTKIQDGPDYS